MAKLFLDGLPGVGKTTVCHQLNKLGIQTIPDISAKVRQRDFPGDGVNLETSIEILSWFIIKEQERLKYEGVFDRSFLSHLAYAYAYEKFQNLQGLFSRYLDTFEDLIACDTLRLPDKMVILTTEVPKISRDRLIYRSSQSGRSWLPFFWYDAGFRVNYFNLLSTLSACFSGANYTLDNTTSAIETAGVIKDLFYGDIPLSIPVLDFSRLRDLK